MANSTEAMTLAEGTANQLRHYFNIPLSSSVQDNQVYINSLNPSERKISFGFSAPNKSVAEEVAHIFVKAIFSTAKESLSDKALQDSFSWDPTKNMATVNLTLQASGWFRGFGDTLYSEILKQTRVSVPTKPLPDKKHTNGKATYGWRPGMPDPPRKSGASALKKAKRLMPWDSDVNPTSHKGSNGNHENGHSADISHLENGLKHLEHGPPHGREAAAHMLAGTVRKLASALDDGNPMHQQLKGALLSSDTVAVAAEAAHLGNTFDSHKTEKPAAILHGTLDRTHANHKKALMKDPAIVDFLKEQCEHNPGLILLLQASVLDPKALAKERTRFAAMLEIGERASVQPIECTPPIRARAQELIDQYLAPELDVSRR